MIFVLTIINNVNANNILRTKIIGHYSLFVTRYSLLIILGIQTPADFLVRTKRAQRAGLICILSI